MGRIYGAKISYSAIITMAVMSVVIYLIVLSSAGLRESANKREGQTATAKLVSANRTIDEYCKEKGITQVQYNGIKTYLIGPEFTEITTDRGQLEVKLIALDKRWAVVFIDILRSAGLKPGDAVAMSMTGSFPCLNIAMISAVETLNLKPVIISSVGSSNWGATNPDFTWLDIESLLYAKGIIRSKSICASIGGSNDNGRGLTVEGRELIKRAIERNKLLLIAEGSVEKNVDKRMKLYEKYAGQNHIRAFINIGGGVAGIGPNSVDRIPEGLSKNLLGRKFYRKSVVSEMSKKGIPVIHILEISKLAGKYGINAAGKKDGVYGKRRVPAYVSIPGLLLIIVVVVVYAIRERRKYKL